MPLARIKELLAAEPDRFAAAIAEIDRNLQERAEEVLRTRERIAQLRAGDRLFVFAEVADFLDQLHQLGVSQNRQPSGSPTMRSASANRRGTDCSASSAMPGPDHRPTARDIDRRVVAGLGPAHRDAKQRKAGR